MIKNIKTRKEINSLISQCIAIMPDCVILADNNKIQVNNNQNKFLFEAIKMVDYYSTVFSDDRVTISDDGQRIGLLINANNLLTLP
jgi:hypothetical protein